MTTTQSSYAAAIEIGQVRDRQEDCFRAGPDTWIVCDGMGGHRGGADASANACMLIDVVMRSSELPPGQRWRLAVSLAHEELLHFETFSDMGTTFVGAHREGENVHVAWVGDSRAYVLDEGTLSRLSEDHNRASELVRAGRLSAVDARNHPGRHRLTRCLGAGIEAVPDVEVVTYPATGRLMLCTDGLNGELGDTHIAELLARGTPQDAADALVRSAVAAGGRDNVTAVVVDLAPAANRPVAAGGLTVERSGASSARSRSQLRTPGHASVTTTTWEPLEARPVESMVPRTARPRRARPRTMRASGRGVVAPICGACDGGVDALGHCRCCR